jgi:predicted nucleic acid-binding protein
MDFYERYQDLDEKSKERNVSFVKLRDKPGMKWKDMAQNVIKSIKVPNDKEVLLGKTKVFMSADFQAYLHDLLEEKQKGKRLAMQKLASSIKSFVFAVKWEECRKTKIKVCHLSRNLLNTWNSKIEYLKFKKFLSVVKRMEKIYKMTIMKRHLRLKKYSTQVIGRSFKLYKIRKMLFNAKKIIIAVNKCSRKIMFRLFMVRMRINKDILDDIFENAWVEIASKFKVKAAMTIQRISRGYFERIRFNEEVRRLIIVREDRRDNRAAICIQRFARGFRVRNRLDRMNRAALYIQGYMRSLYMSFYFQMVKKAVRTIQRIMRMYMVKNKVIKKKLDKFFTKNKNSMEQLRALEYSVIFKKLEGFFTLENLENYTRVKFFEGDDSFRDSIPKVETFIPKLPIIDLHPKMRMFSILIDFDCQMDTSDFYKQSWAVDFLTFMKTLKRENTRLLQLEVGESFTFAITDELKIYSWGLNDYHQQTLPLNPLMNHNSPTLPRNLNRLSPRILSTGDDHSVMIDYKNEVYVWGSNRKGQFGLGHPREVKSIVKLTSLGKNLKSVASKGKTNYVVTGDGNILKWPNQEEHCKYVPMLMQMNEKWLKFQNVSCGYDYAIGLTENGILFSYGKNDYGQLGQGDNYDRDIFSIIESLKDQGEKITEVSCGNKHAVCKTANGKAYTWGMGKFGQLGTGMPDDFYDPELVYLPDQKLKSLKVISVQAGFNSTYLLYEDRKMYFAGRTALKQQNTFMFKKIKLGHKVKDL